MSPRLAFIANLRLGSLSHWEIAGVDLTTCECQLLVDLTKNWYLTPFDTDINPNVHLNTTILTWRFLSSNNHYNSY